MALGLALLGLIVFCALVFTWLGATGHLDQEYTEFRDGCIVQIHQDWSGTTYEVGRVCP